MFLPFRRFDAKNQHVFGEPALFARKVRTDAQRQAFFRKQDVSAVTGANRDDRVILRKMTNEAPLRIDIEQRMHPAVPFRLRIAAKPFDRDLPIRVIIRMLSTTYLESVISNPIFVSGESGGPIM